MKGRLRPTGCGSAPPAARVGNASHCCRCLLAILLCLGGAGGGRDLVAALSRRPTFTAEELERERQLRIAALDAIAEDPGAVARRVATEPVYAGHPYGLEPTIPSLEALSRDELSAYYKRFV